MSDVKYDQEKLVAEGGAFIEKFRSRMKAIADETFGELYVNLMPYLETDTWTNYREALRLELEHEYKFSNFKQDWATNFRRAVFVENREEISKHIEQDILKRIKHLEDCKQEYEQFRYTPRGDAYQDLKKKLDIATQSLRKISSGLTTQQEMVERMTKREADEALKEIETNY